MIALVGLVLLGLAALYLLGLGIAAIARPRLAHEFLSAFAQTPMANRLEAGGRALAGAGMMMAAPRLPGSAYWVGGGIFLIVTAALMLIFPDFHRLLARRSVSSIRRMMPLVGIGGMAMGLGLALALLAALES